MKTQIDFGETAGEDTARRPLRREVPVPKRQAPATVAGIAAPTRKATQESPRGMSEGANRRP